jgi:hypothetical protein
MADVNQLYQQAQQMYADRDRQIQDYLNNQYQQRFSSTPELDFVQASGDSVLNSFFRQPEYMIQYGQNANQIDPTQRFKFDPGYQFAVDEGLIQLQRGAAAKGMLESGPLMREIIRQTYGQADQNYNRWQTQQYNTLQNYQSKLAALAGLGPTVNGANNAMATGQSSAQAAQNTSGQLANLYNSLGGGALNARTSLGNTGLQAYTQAGIAKGQIQAANSQAMMSGAGQLLGALIA